MKNHVGVRHFTARTIHSAPLMMSVVQVFFHDKMAALGHLIASDQLPLPTQVCILFKVLFKRNIDGGALKPCN